MRKTQNIVAEWICNLNAGSMGVQGTQELFRIQGLGALPISVRCVALKASQNKSGVQT